MGARDPRIDAYIDRAAPFAQPILHHLRDIVHGACPAIEEDVKWGFPHFLHHGIVCSMAAFQRHCAFTFWRPEPLGLEAPAGRNRAMGQFGRITGIGDLPSRAVLTRYVKQAAALNASGAKAARPEPKAKTVRVPPALAEALQSDAAARAGYERLTPAQRRDYAAWIDDAKRDETRRRRLATAVEWLREGKPRDWKYR
ncbi:MAG: YdeI/OmpD-associated family protein [Pseudomonadales bacterium]